MRACVSVLSPILIVMAASASAQLAGSSASFGAQVGKRQARDEVVQSIKPTVRIDNRLQTRIDSRLHDRIDHGKTAQRDTLSPFETANRTARSTRLPTER